MKSEFTFFTKQAVVSFLANHGREGTKDYEFAAALVICRLCEKRWGEDCWIGTRIKREYQNTLPAYNSQKTVTLKGIAELLKKGTDEDSPVDFVVAKRADMKKAQGMIFQVKRFGIGRDKKDTDALVSYINSLAKKYAKADANLLVCLDDHVSVDITEFYKKFDMSNFPFNRLLFNWFSSNEAFLQDVYPKGERETFKISELFAIN